MIVNIVYIHLKHAYIEEFMDVTRLNHQNSLQEIGNLRFDFLQDADDPTKFVLYEAFNSKMAVDTHQQSAHHKSWKETVEPWMAKKCESIKYEVVAPLSHDLW